MDNSAEALQRKQHLVKEEETANNDTQLPNEHVQSPEDNPLLIEDIQPTVVDPQFPDSQPPEENSPSDEDTQTPSAQPPDGVQSSNEDTQSPKESMSNNSSVPRITRHTGLVNNSSVTRLTRHTDAKKSRTEYPSYSAGSTKKNSQKKRGVSYRRQWKANYDWVRESAKGKSRIFCNICNCDLLIKHGGQNDIYRHSLTMKHQRFTRKKRAADQLTQTASAILQAEAAFVNMLAEHNISFSAGNNILKFIKQYCTDLKVIKALKCTLMQSYTGDDKVTTGVVVEPEPQNDVAAVCRRVPFYVSLGQNTKGLGEDKLFILVGFFDENLGRNVVQYLNVSDHVSGTGQAMFDFLMETFKKFDIPSDNIVAFSSDNGPPMIDVNDSVISRLKQINPNIINIGYLFNLPDLACKSGVQALSAPIEELISDIYYHFFHISQQEPLGFALFDEEPCIIADDLLGFCKAIKKMLELWPDLLSFFLSYAPQTAKVQLICQRLQCLELRLLFLFLKQAVEPLNQFRQRLGNGESQLMTLQRDLSGIVRIYAGRLLLPGAAINLLKSGDVQLLNNTGNFLPPNEVRVGPEVERYLKDQGDDLSVSAYKSRFFEKASLFYAAVLEKMLKKLELNDKFLKDMATLLNPANKLKVSMGTVMDIASQLGVCNASDGYQLKDEFSLYQLSDACSAQQSDTIGASVLQYWSGVLKDCCGSEEQMPLFRRLILTLLCVLHSNVEQQEQAFTLVRKTNTKTNQAINLKSQNAVLSGKRGDDSNILEEEQHKQINTLVKQN
ncbi:uncharacterized protein LOC121319467 [Polyodon spathula]|uniref:uncharacterized protein LOC121319467 n=1 Tax=Polyodon spathula TaxID=7913 RepID=UPI001B7F1967|nr:uncharacterized protein LOC121319467 [Polyodon spathula]